MFLNSMLIWSLFLPLGKSISVDALMKSLKNFQELTVEDLNNRDTLINKPIQIYSIARLFLKMRNVINVSRTKEYLCLNSF